jgi:hypothetical protein
VHEGGGTGGEVDDAVGDLLGLGRAAGGSGSGECLEAVAHRAGAGRAGGSRADGIDADPPWAVFGCQRFRQQLDRRLGRAVQRHARYAESRDHRADVDDGPRTTGGHCGREFGDEEIGRLDVDPDRDVELGLGRPLGRPEGIDARVVDQYVDPAAGKGGRRPSKESRCGPAV